MLDQKIAQEVIDCALSTGGDFAEIFYEDRLNNGVMMRSGKVESINSGRLHGAGVRVYLGLRGVYVYTNDTTREGLLACARRAASALHADSRVTAQPLRATEYVNCHPIAILPSQVKTARKIEKMRAAQGVLSQYDEVVQGMIRYTDSEQRVWIANSDGLYTSDTRVYTRMSISAIASNGTENQTGTSNPGALQGFEIFDSRIDPEAAAHKAAKQAITMLHAPVCPAGIMPVVIDNGFGGVIFHEACGHSLEATSVAYGNSVFCGKLGQKVASELVNAVDDGTIPHAWGSNNIDDEGYPCRRNLLIENGILKGYLIDPLNARRMEMEATGSSRRQDYTFEPTSRMTNTFLLNGTSTVEEIIADTSLGLYAKRLGGGSVNPVTGDFNFAVLEAYMIRGGQIAEPVRGATLIGNGAEILFKIDKIADNGSREQGMCGSKSGSIPTDVGQPTIRVRSMTVGGKGGKLK